MMEAICSSETSGFFRATQRYNPEDRILQINKQFLPPRQWPRYTVAMRLCESQNLCGHDNLQEGFASVGNQTTVFYPTVSQGITQRGWIWRLTASLRHRDVNRFTHTDVFSTELFSSYRRYAEQELELPAIKHAILV
jgi:hypothetical protein